MTLSYVNRAEESIEETFQVLYICEQARTASINLNKTVGIHLGRWKIKSQNFKQIKWANYYVKTLGVIHEHNVNIDALWLETNHENNIPNKL